MKKKSLFSMLTIAVSVVFIVIACRKVDHHVEQPTVPGEGQAVFFDTYYPQDITTVAIHQYFKKGNEKYHFAEKYLKKLGVPRWNKAQVFSSATGQRTAARGESPEGTDSTIVYIPIVKDTQNFVSSAFVVKIKDGDTTVKIMYDWKYKYYQSASSPTDDWNAHSVFHLFSVLDKSVFGTTQYILTDKKLFTPDVLSKIAEKGLPVDSLDVEVTIKDQASAGTSARGIVPVMICNSIEYCVKYKEKELLGFRGAAEPEVNAVVPGRPCEQVGTYQICNTVWFEDDGGNPPNPGGGEGGGGGGEGGGGGWPDPNNPCDPAGQPAGGFSDPNDPCSGGGGWVPVVNPNLLPIDPVHTWMDASFQGNTTYVTSAGVPITLPSTARVRCFQNIDIDIFPNGALYSFEVLKPGTNNQYDTYVSIQKEYLAPGALVVPKPEYTGFYKIEDNKVNFSAPYPNNAYVTPQPNSDGIVKVVRFKIIKNVNGSCSIQREIVDYTPAADMPPNAGMAELVNDNIEYAPVSAGQTPSVPTPIGFCPGGGSSGHPVMNTNEFKTIYGPAIKEFFNNRLNIDIKVYLVDCNSPTNTTYSISKSGVTTLTTNEAQAFNTKFNNNGFAATDEQVAVKACIQDSKWNFSIKVNTARLGTVHSKFSGNTLNAAISALEEMVKVETRHLQGVGKVAAEEKYTTYTGEKFFITQMGLFEKIGAIYDVGCSIIKEGKLPETVWDRGRRKTTTDVTINQKFEKSPFGMPPVVAGAADQLIENATDGIMLLKTGVESLSRPGETYRSLKKAVSELSWEKVKNMVSDATGASNYTAGGDRGFYQGGKHTLMAATIWFTGVSGALNGKKKVKDASDGVNDLQKFIPEGATGVQVSDVVKNAQANNKLVKNIDNEKLVTKNIDNGQELTVGIEKSTTGEIKVYKAKDADLVDHRSGVVYSAEEIAESARDINKAKTVTTVNGRTVVETEAGTTGGWNKEMNNPKPNSDYKITNGTPGGHKYTIDAQGRIAKAEGALSLNTRNRNGYQQSVKCKASKDGLPDDHGGHLFASIFDGAGEQINLLPMKSSLNLGAWKSMENEWKSLLQQGKSVRVEITPIYDGSGLRPDAFEIDYWIDGVKQPKKTFEN